MTMLSFVKLLPLAVVQCKHVNLLLNLPKKVLANILLEGLGEE